MNHRTLFLYLVVLLFIALPLTAQAASSRSAWDALIQERPSLANEASPLEREILQLMTPQQVDAYLTGTPSAWIILATGETLEALMTGKANGTFDLSWYTIDGGGTTSTGGTFTLGGTIGQPDAGVMNAGGYALTGGFWAAAATGLSAGPLVEIPAQIPAFFGDSVDVPIIFAGNGAEISATTFKIDYDETCLGFNPADSDFDGNLDNVSFSLPPAFTGAATFTPGDVDGELEITIADFTTPLASLPDGEILVLTFVALCEPTTASIIADVNFSDWPAPTFGDNLGQDVPGSVVNGSVEILPGFPGTPGDCNRDGSVTAGDISACVLEAFDGDGNLAENAPGGSFPGSVIGCDANGDGTIGAGDLSCKILIIFDGPAAACSVPKSSQESWAQNGWAEPILYVRREGERRYEDASPVQVYFRPRGWAINSLIFSVNYDERTFAFDPIDADGDGIPDALRFNLPASAQVTATFDPADADGELDVSILDPLQVLDLGAEPILEITLERRKVPTKAGAGGVGFSRDPAASFGDLSGRSVDGKTFDSLVN